MTASHDTSAPPLADAPRLKEMQPWTVQVTDAERIAGTLSPENITRATQGLNVEGVIVLKGVVYVAVARVLLQLGREIVVYACWWLLL